MGGGLASAPTACSARTCPRPLRRQSSGHRCGPAADRRHHPPDSVRAVLRREADVVVNVAAYTAVDAAEDDEATALRTQCWKACGSSPARWPDAPRGCWCIWRPTTCSAVMRDPALRRGRRPGLGVGLRLICWPRSPAPPTNSAPYIVRTAGSLYGQHGGNSSTPCSLEAKCKPWSARGRPARPADLDDGLNWVDRRPGRCRRPGGHLPRHLVRGDDLVRVHQTYRVDRHPSRVQPTNTDAFPGPPRAPRSACWASGPAAEACLRPHPAVDDAWPRRGCPRWCARGSNDVARVTAATRPRRPRTRHRGPPDRHTEERYYEDRAAGHRGGLGGHPDDPR